MLSLLTWLALGGMHGRLPRRATILLAVCASVYGLALTGWLDAISPQDRKGGSLYYLLVQLAACAVGLSLMRSPGSPQAAMLWGYLAAIYPTASGNSLAGSAGGAALLLAAAALTRLPPLAMLLGLATLAALQAMLERQALLGLFLSPPLRLTLDPLDGWLPEPGLLHFAASCLLLVPTLKDRLGWQWGLLLWSGSVLSPYPGPWVLLLLALLAARSRRAAVALLALGLVVSVGPWLYEGTIREHQLGQLQKGQLLSAKELARLLPPDKLQGGHFKYPNFPELPVQEREADRPDWMVVSNNPEMVDPQGQCANLYRGVMPAGVGRLFLSHFNIRPQQPVEMVLTFRNPGPRPVTATWGRKVWYYRLSPTAGDELWRDYLAARPSGASFTVAPGESRQESLPDVVGNAVCMADLTLDHPLELTVSFLPPGAARAVDGPVWGLVFRQSRGLYRKPDRVLTARVELTDMVVCEPLKQHLVGRDGGRTDELKGSYGAVETLDFELVPQGKYRRALILLVPRAGYLAAVLDGRLRAIAPYGALVLANLKVDGPTRWSWVYSLPANSFAPNGILVVPLRQGG